VPLPTPVSAIPVATVQARRASRASRPVFALLVIAAVLGADTAVLGSTAAIVTLALGCAALLAAGVLGLRAQWLTMVAEDAARAAAVPAPRSSADRTEELRSLRDRYVAAVNNALDEDDLPRARELADAYTDDSLRVLTR
jgi:hypothetical protein